MPVKSLADRSARASSAREGSRPATRWLLALVTLLITYGSLYPFDFTQLAAPAATWKGFLSHLRMPASLGDILGNWALFMPFGFAGMLSIRLRTGVGRGIATLVAALVLAVVLQALQVHLPSRTAALGDVVWNMLGTAVGVALAQPVMHRMAGLPTGFASLPAGLIALWLGAELLPFVPSLDWQGVKDSIKPLLRGEIPVGALALHTAGVLLAGEALARIASPRRALVALTLLAASIVVGKLIVVTQRLDAAFVVGLAAGWLAWLAVRTWPAARRRVLVVTTLMIAYALAALAPFELAASPNAFNWVPFAGSLRGAMLDNARALATSALVFAGLAWLAKEAGGSARAVGGGLAGIALILELAQIYIRGRTPDLTEPLIAVLAGFVVHAWPEGARVSLSGIPTRPTAPAPSPVPSAGPHPTAAPLGWAGWGLRLLVACVVIAMPVIIALRLPGIPYNMAELFLANGAVPVLLVFALALLWVGAGPILIADWVGGDRRRDWLVAPLAFGAGLVSLVLLWLSVTDESIGDIAGSNNLYWFVTNKDTWGSWMRQVFLAIGSPELIAFFERPIRYAALYGPVVTFPAVMLLALDARRTGTLSARRVAVWLVTCGLWLWLCKGIAFDWSSTDNLNELIARDGRYGLGGGGYLYLLVALISANVVGLARMPLRPWSIAAGAAVTVLLVPVGWWLLTHGLERAVHKYGNVFPGEQFLLGPDRRQLLSEQALFLRWSLVQLGGIAVAVTGARLASRVPWPRLRQAFSTTPILGSRIARGDRKTPSASAPTRF